MLGPDRRIIQSSGNGMRQCDLSGFVLQNIRERALQYSRHASAKTRCVIAKLFAATASFNTNQLYFLVADELVKNSNRIGSAANACNDRRRQLSFRFQNLTFCLFAD